MPFNLADSPFFLGSDLPPIENSGNNFAPTNPFGRLEPNTFGSPDLNFLTALLQPTDPEPYTPLDRGPNPTEVEPLQPNFNLFGPTSDPTTFETEVPIDFGQNFNLLAQGGDPNSPPSFVPTDLETGFTFTQPTIEPPFQLSKGWAFTCPSGGSLFCCPDKSDENCIPGKQKSLSVFDLIYSTILQQDFSRTHISPDQEHPFCKDAILVFCCHNVDPNASNSDLDVSHQSIERRSFVLPFFLNLVYSLIPY
jgi:hypothetical protein